MRLPGRGQILREVYQAEENRTILYLNYEKQEAQGIYENGQTYLPADWVAEHVNSRFYWDENEEMLVYALPEEILYTDDTAVGSSGEPLIVKREDGVYLSMGLVLNYTKVRIQAFDSTDIKRVFIENDWDGTPTADVRGRVKVRVEAGRKKPYSDRVLQRRQRHCAGNYRRVGEDRHSRRPYRICEKQKA